MAAPANVYVDNANFILATHKIGVVKYDCLVALSLLEYGNNIKELFYLDGVFQIPEKEGFIGLVKIGSLNYYKHNPNRFYKINLKDMPAGYVALNDAGLNTKGHCDAPVVISNVIGSISYKAFFKSAYYVDTDQTIIAYKINNGAWNIQTGGTIPQRQSLERSYSLGALAPINAGDTLYIKSSIINSEGQWDQSVITSVVIVAKSISLKYNSAWPSLATQVVTAYVKENTMYSGFYKDEACTIPYEDGYYVDSSKWYELRSGVIVLIGTAASGGWPPGDPGNPSVTTWEYYGFSTISRADATANEFPTPIATIYRRDSDALWFKNYVAPNTFTGLVDNGYYSAGGITRAYNNGKQMPLNWNGPFG